MIDREVETANQIKRFILDGRLGGKPQNAEQLIDRLSVLLCHNDSSQVLASGVLFEDEHGEYHRISSQAVICSVPPGNVDALLGDLPFFDPAEYSESGLPTGKGLVIKRVISEDDLDVRGIKTADKLLKRANLLLRKYDAQDDVGDILFENVPGDYFTVTVEAVLSTPDPEWVEEMKELDEES